MSHCKIKKRRPNYLLFGSLTIILLAYFSHLLAADQISSIESLQIFTSSTFEIMNKMWWGLLIGILFVGILGNIPREFIVKALGKGGNISGILRATAAGVLLDLCSHGILLIGMKLYERGASLGQTMAFLIASPWNSFSLTLVLIALIGFKWTIMLLLLSMVIAVISGLIFDQLVKKGTLPKNPNQIDLPKDFNLIKEVRWIWKQTKFTPNVFYLFIKNGIKGSRMILKWIFFGVVIAALVRTILNPAIFEQFFGPTVAGLGLTILVATIIEVCSEGSAPLAADILTRAKAPGNAFGFLMTGVSTDYTEIISIRQTTKSWKIALFLPLITLPQIVTIAVIINATSAL